ncbi:MAG: transcriptional regulator [Lachnospiraceae bacterium]|jgi:DNA-binding HxlR family transcriptional regulator|nr:transcriptional regulator [Lachnospiraceae bacterium]
MNINSIPEMFCLSLRIKIISCLLSSSKNFNELLEITQTTRGNLSVQLSKLEEYGYLTSRKIIEKKKTKTTYTLTTFGVQQFEEYVTLLQSIIEKSK